jgi:predicted flavoprotein YhiN
VVCDDIKHIIVIGGGASGMLAAGRAAETGANVLLMERKEQLGQKILLTGQTRCNLTNTSGIDNFILSYGENGKFLYSAFNRFFRDDILALVGRYGVNTKVESDGKIFPVSDKSRDVVNALKCYMSENGVTVHSGVRVTRVVIEGGQVVGVMTKDRVFPASAVVIATGGISYPLTGSTGDGYSMAAELGHTIIPLRQSLVPLVVVEDKLARKLQGVSLANVRLAAFGCSSDKICISTLPAVDSGRGIPGKPPKFPVIASLKGDMIFTHFGLSGPVILKLSLAIVDALGKGPVSVSIDLQPDVSIRELHQILESNLDHNGKKLFRNILGTFVPARMIDIIMDMSRITAEKTANQITSVERESVINIIKSLKFNIKSALPMTEAMVTAGGVNLKEIDSRTMASRLIRGLYFCGEVMDIDGSTGGYNLQAAFSTGFIAGENAAIYVHSLIS